MSSRERILERRAAFFAGAAFFPCFRAGMSLGDKSGGRDLKIAPFILGAGLLPAVYRRQHTISSSKRDTSSGGPGDDTTAIPAHVVAKLLAVRRPPVVTENRPSAIRPSGW
jgi:hypothetical protein